MILEVTPDSSALVRGAATTLLYLHITSGAIGILSGVGALIVSKGGRLHRAVGTVFFVSMLIMSAIGTLVSPFLPTPQWPNVFVGALTFYLVATSWMTVRRKEGTVGYFEVGAFIVATGFAAAALVVGTLALNAPDGTIAGLPYQAAYGFGAPWVLVAIADFKLLMRSGVVGAQRVARHLWRMCVALIIAVVSLFVGQPQLFPDVLRGTGALFLPGIAVLGSMFYWLARVRFAKVN